MSAEVELRHPGGASPIGLWAGSIVVAPTTRVLGSGEVLEFRIGQAYVVDPIPEDVRIEIAVGEASLEVGAPFPDKVSLTLPENATGDFEVTIRAIHGDRELRTFIDRVAVIPEWEERTAALETLFAGKIEGRSVEEETASALWSQLQWSRMGIPLELPIHGAAELARTERLVARAVAGERAPELATPGERWVKLPIGSRGTAVRIRVPEAASSGPCPLVLAVHGMGGSGHMFYEAFGLGLGPRLAEERGWIFAAPFLGTLVNIAEVGEVVTALESFLSIDRDRIFLIGHSLGAMRVGAAVVKAPKRYRAIAPLSGGAALPFGTELTGLPCFVAAGDRDFGRGMAMAAKFALEKAGAEVTYRIYSPSEHMLMVGDALPDVFAHFDATLLTAAAPTPASAGEGD